MSKKYTLLFLMVFGFTLSGFAQNRTVTGTVTGAKSGNPLPGVNIKVKGTARGTTTNGKGKYSLSVPSLQDTLIFSYIGYKTKTVPIGGRTTIKVPLKSITLKGQQMVVVGYGEQKRSDLSSSIATVSPQTLQKNSTLPNAASALEGTTPGVSVTPSSGQPGASFNIRVRGTNSFGNNNPLVIIDGSPGSLSDVNPSDIASIQVLKDASAAAIYGSRAANGVIIVKTKNGKKGKPQVTFHASYGVQSPEKLLSVANAGQYAKIDNALHKTAGLAPFKALSNPSSLGKGTNWQKAFYNPAPLYKAYLGISNGTKHTTSRISGSFNKQKGIAKATHYRKTLLHYNGSQDIGAFSFNESLTWKEMNQRMMPYGGDKPLTEQVLLAQPIFSVHNPKNEGGFGGAPSYLATQAFNPVGLAVLQHNSNHNDRFHADVNGKLTFLKHFYYKINASYSVQNGYYRSYTPTYYMSTERHNVRASLTENRWRNHHWLLENTLHFKRQIGKNNLDLMAGYTAEENHNTNTQGSASGFPNNSLRVLGATTGYSINASGNVHRWDLVSELGRINYHYGNKYYLTANIRRDGSSRFGRSNQYGIFPSASAAWRISSEPFFNSLTSIVSNLKFRASYGVLGNEPNGEYSYIPTINYSTYLGYLFGGGYSTGAAEESFANRNVKWETTKDLDVGLNLGLFSHLSLKADYYLDKTDHVLLHVPIPPSTGTNTPPLVNTGKLRNEGIEFSLNYNSPTYSSGFQYSIKANISTERNKVLKLGYTGQVIKGAAPHRASTGAVTEAKVGYPIGAFFVMQADGLFQNEQQVKNWTNSKGQLLQPKAKPGDVRYKDVNGDGKITTADVAYSGSPFPKFNYGFNFSANYKHFDFTLFIQGAQGKKMFDANKWILNRGTLDYNFSTDMLNAWSPNNKDTNVPRLTFNDPNHNSRPSTRFLSNASYLRFKTVQFGYILPKSLLSNYGVSKLRLFINAHNLLTITPYTGYDPSYTGDGLLNRGLDQGLYPVARTINGGIDIKF